MFPTTPRTRLELVAVFGLVAATLVGCVGTSANTPDSPESTSFTVTHPAVPAPTLIPRAEAVPSVGDVRLWNFDGTTEDGEVVTMDWIMTTTALDVPTVGLETRFTTGVFTFASSGNGDADQIILEGVAYYPTAGSVLESASSTVRAVVGGTGRFDGARGSVESIHLADDTWRHVFTLR